MDIMLVLVSLFLLFVGIGLYAGICNHSEERRAEERERLAETTSPEAVSKRHDLPIKLAVLFCLAPVWVVANAQEVVHARTGQVIAVNSAAHTLSLKIADGSILLFHDVGSPAPNLSFDKILRDKTVPVGTFNKVGSYVVVFYYGFGTPTAVAIKELAQDAVLKMDGSVASFDRHQHILTLKTDSAGPQKLVLNEDTVVDTSDGIVKLSDYHPFRGQHVRCFTKTASQAALVVIPD